VELITAAGAAPVTTGEHLAARQLDGRTGTADEIAETIAFIASDSGRFLNGASVMVDGGGQQSQPCGSPLQAKKSMSSWLTRSASS
jgi:NAD(P)-dependent dehydrogenase (short-subunit alcohol dehydrogenase family)